MQLRDRVAEAVVVDEVVPIGDQVAERAAVVAERHAAVHAARALVAQLGHRPRHEELVVVVRTLAAVPVGNAVPLDLQEAAQLAHQAPAPPTASSGRWAGTAPFAAAWAASASSSSVRSRSTRL